MTAPASRSASIGPSAAGRFWPSAIPTAICRCCDTRQPARRSGSGFIVHHDDAEREYAYDRQSMLARRQYEN